MAMSTPWGPAQTTEDIGRGIVSVTTASHGGLRVPPELNRSIPLAWREASFNGRGKSGWYEEDCDWCMVALTFPTCFTTPQLIAAQRTFDAWIAPKLVKAA